MALSLKDFGEALARERDESGYSLANLSKNMGGISKSDIRDWEAGEKAPRKLEIKQIMRCFPKLRVFEEPLLRGDFDGDQKSEVHHAKPKKTAPPKSESRLKAAPRLQSPQLFSAPLPRPVFAPPPPPPTPLPPPPQRERRVPVEVVTQKPLPPAPLSYSPFAQGLRKTRAEMLSDLSKLVTKRLGNITAEDYDFTIKNDGKSLVVKLQVEEKGEEDLVDSGCYVTVGAREPAQLVVLTRATTSGYNCDSQARIAGVLALLEVSQLLHDAVKDRRFE